MGASLNSSPAVFHRYAIGDPNAGPPAPLYLPLAYALPGGALPCPACHVQLAMRQAFPWGKRHTINF